MFNHDLGAYKQRTGHFLMDALREQRVVNAKRFLKHYTGECSLPTRCSQWSSVLMLKMTVCSHHHHSKLLHVFPECKGPITQHQSWCGGE
jgi:hypothetical protein